MLRSRVRSLASRAIPGRALEDDELEMLMSSPLADQARHMLTYTATGGAEAVRAYLSWFGERAAADELTTGAGRFAPPASSP